MKSALGSSTRCRAFLFATVSWVGFAPAPAAQDEPPPIGRASIESELHWLDEALARGSVSDYVGRFEPDHPGAHAMLERRLRRLTSCGRAIRRTSTILGEPRTVGPRTVVRVRSELRVEGEKRPIELEDTIYWFREEDGRAIPTFAVATPRSPDCPATNLFRCPPCNYEIGAVDGWICVPMGRHQAQALEASSFYLTGTDLACDVSVRIGTADAQGRLPSATAIVEELASALLQVEPRAEPGLATRWLPPAHREAPHTMLEGARIEIALPATDEAPEGGIAVFHVVRLGALQHLLLVRSSRRSFEKHRASLRALLASFHLLELNRELAEAAAMPLRHHVGGRLEGSTYRNERYEVTLTGPDGWRAQQRGGGATLRVLWRSPSGGRLWLTAWSPPPALENWSEGTAMRWVRQLAASAGLAMPSEPAIWTDGSLCGTSSTRLHCRVENAEPGEPSTRLLLVALRPDLLVVADGGAVTERDRVAIEHALDSLRL